MNWGRPLPPPSPPQTDIVHFFYRFSHRKASLKHILEQGAFVKRWGLLADRYGLPIRDYWQTVHKICEQFANLFLLADP